MPFNSRWLRSFHVENLTDPEILLPPPSDNDAEAKNANEVSLFFLLNEFCLIDAL